MNKQLYQSHYRTLIIGLGQVGMGYDLLTEDQSTILTHAKALALSPEFKLSCAVDFDQYRRQTFQNKYETPAYASLNEALERHEIDLVIVATPTISHYCTIQELLKLCKPNAVLCEKPIAYDLEDSKALVANCAEAEVHLYVNYMRRSEPGVLEVKQRIDQGNISGAIKGVAWYAKGLLHNGSHLINLCEFWLGDSVGFDIVNRGRSLSEGDAMPDVQIHFALGSVLFLGVDKEKYSYHSIDLMANNGRLKYDEGGHIIRWTPVADDKSIMDQAILSEASEAIDSQLKKYQSFVFANLARHLSGMPANLCTGLQALKTHEIVDKILRARE